MKEQEQRIAIAKACGITISPNGVWSEAGRILGGVHPKPDYLNDLNAMHEAMGALTGLQYRDFIRHLSVMFADHPDDGYQSAIIATAAQRAEAFLKTLNLWTD